MKAPPRDKRKTLKRLDPHHTKCVAIEMSDASLQAWQHYVQAEEIAPLSPKGRTASSPHHPSITVTKNAPPPHVIDLHHHTLNQAHTTLLNGLARAHQANYAEVLVITGKGSGTAGTLRHDVPYWLETVPTVKQWYIAPQQLGGEGALIVQLMLSTPHP